MGSCYIGPMTLALTAGSWPGLISGLVVGLSLIVLRQPIGRFFVTSMRFGPGPPAWAERFAALTVPAMGCLLTFAALVGLVTKIVG